jgi:hypothetical protein
VYGGGTNCPAWTLGTGSSSELSPQAQSWGVCLCVVGQCPPLGVICTCEGEEGG